LLKFYDIFINLKLNAMESHPVHRTTASEKRKAFQETARNLSRDACALQRRPPVHPQLAGRQREAARRGGCELIRVMPFLAYQKEIDAYHKHDM
jgi:hypothetical protein